MNMAVAYGSLTADQLKRMLDAAHANHRQQLAETKAKWAAEVAALREALSRAQAKWTTELHTQRKVNSDLRYELDIVYAELAKANTTITEQEQRLSAHNAVVELEKKLNIARRAAS
jgi:hypothetical protein